LPRVNEELRRFAILAHDLRASLINIIGFTGCLKTAPIMAPALAAAGLKGNDNPLAVSAGERRGRGRLV
jgi:hypothetical protein